MFNEGVVFFGCGFGERVKPVGVVCGIVLHRPFFHTFGHSVGYGYIKGGTIVYYIYEAVEYIFGKILIHLLTIKNLHRIVIGWALFFVGNIYRTLAKCRCNYFES